MGLDLSLYAHLKNRQTGKGRDIEIAYWRKCYAIRDMMVEEARKNPLNIKEEDLDDVVITCSSAAVRNMIDLLLNEINNRESSFWSDSIWGIQKTRDMTLKNISEMETFLDWNNAECDNEDLIDILNLNDPIDGRRQDYDIFFTVLNSY